MFRLLRLFIVLGTGIAIGIWLERMLMKSKCAAGEGQWAGTICVNSELFQ
jgi:predicted NBD/HSP70 family sugar kinase